MWLQQWFRPPRHLLVLFLGTTLAFLAGLGYIGWRAIRDFEDDERRAAQERLESTAGTVAEALGRKLAELELQLARLSSLRAEAVAGEAAAFAASLGDHAVVAVFEPDSVRGYPPQRLLYYPVLPAAEEPYVYAVMPGRLRAGADSATTLRYLERMAASGDPRIRAEALLNLARHHERLERFDAALAAYAELRDPAVLVDGRPAELVARIAACGLLKRIGRQPELLEAVRRLKDDLHHARWTLTWVMFDRSVEQVRDCQGGNADASEPEATARALSDAVRALWTDWQEVRGRGEPFASRTNRVFRNQPVFMAWRGTEDRGVVLVGGPRYLQHQLVEPLRDQVLAPRNVRVGLLDGERTVVPVGNDSGLEPVSLSPDQAQLPWTLRVVSANPEVDSAPLVVRQRLLITGLGLLALIVVAGTYFSARAMTRELNAARLQSDFVAAVSHEFRTPLTLLRQFSDLLADGRVASDDERRMYYAALQRGTRRLTRLVEDLLDFARMEAGSHAFRLARVTVREWLSRVVEEFAEESRSKGYQLDFDWSGPCAAVVRADEAAITRALWNLLDNAVKYSPGCRTIWVRGEAHANEVIVSVRDRGVGVPASEQRAIFRKFVRGSIADSHVVKGTGLGLALVEQIVEAHGGTVRIESAVGEGSTFSIRLPAAVEEQVI